MVRLLGSQQYIPLNRCTSKVDNSIVVTLLIVTPIGLFNSIFLSQCSQKCNVKKLQITKWHIESESVHVSVDFGGLD